MGDLKHNGKDIWRNAAKCTALVRGLETDPDHPDFEDPQAVFFARHTKAAMAICDTCNIWDRCLADGLEWEQKIRWRSGVFGRTTVTIRNQRYGTIAGCDEDG